MRKMDGFWIYIGWISCCYCFQKLKGGNAILVERYIARDIGSYEILAQVFILDLCDFDQA